MEKRKYVPEVFQEEMMRLVHDYYARFSEEEMQDDFDEEDFNHWIDAHASPILKSYMEYDHFCGDEGELFEKDGSFMIDEDGYRIQDWTVDDQGHCYGRNGKQLFCSDGSPVIEPEMPSELKSYFEDGDEE